VPPAACRLPPAACRLPPAACRLPPAACRLPPAACRLPPAACRLPPAACQGFCHNTAAMQEANGARQCCCLPYACRYSNCSATGSISTNTAIYTQQFNVTTTMTCGPDVWNIESQQLTLMGAATTTTTVMDVVYNP
jgi:hypothetical protein